MSTFRTKLVIKRWKSSYLDEAIRQQQDYQKQNVPIHTYQTKSICNRCGMIWDGVTSYCCPEGQMCGVPRHQGPVLIPSIWTSPTNVSPPVRWSAR